MLLQGVEPLPAAGRHVNARTAPAASGDDAHQVVAEADDERGAREAQLALSELVGLELSQYYRNSTAWDAGVRFLTRPRPWVRALGACVMREGGLRPQRFCGRAPAHLTREGQGAAARTS